MRDHEYGAGVTTFTVLFCFIVPLSFATSILFSYSMGNQEPISGAIVDIGASWNLDQVFSISSVPDPPLGPDQYVDKWVGYFPRTKEG